MSAHMDATINSASDVDTKKLYDAQADNWVREKPNCLSDFTGRPIVFNFCGDVTGKQVMDIGCGEGYCARQLKKMGARRIVAQDVSPEMCLAGARVEKKNGENGCKVTYFPGDATILCEDLRKQPAEIVTKEELEAGFDLAIAVFVFNYVSLAEMEAIMKNAFELLKPGGSFVFSVPHPLMASGGSGKDGSFHFGGEEYTGYFSARGKSLPGVIGTRDGKKLNVRMNHKTFQDYVQTLTKVGFTVADLHECSVTEEHLKEDIEFFGPLKDKPLHAVWKATKPSN